MYLKRIKYIPNVINVIRNFESTMYRENLDLRIEHLNWEILGRALELNGSDRLHPVVLF